MPYSREWNKWNKWNKVFIKGSNKTIYYQYILFYALILIIFYFIVPLVPVVPGGRKSPVKSRVFGFFEVEQEAKKVEQVERTLTR
jgi:hypothetical protein